MMRSIMTPIEYADMMNIAITTAFARGPICAQRWIGSQLTASWSRYRDHTCCKSIVLSLSCELNFATCSTDVRNGRSGYLLAQRKVHVDLSLHLYRLSVEEG